MRRARSQSTTGMARLRVLLALGELLLNSSPSRRQVSQSIGVIDLAKHIIGQANARDFPAAMQGGAGGGTQLRRMIEVLIVSLQESPMRHPELVDSTPGIPVGAEQDAVLIFEEELPDHPRR